MNVWLLQTGEPLPIRSGVRKMRTAVLANKLLERGHSVFWWASAFEHQRRSWIALSDRGFTVSERFTIRVLRGCAYHRNVSFTRYIDHQIIALKFLFQSKRFAKPDVIVAAMPDHMLAYEAARYAKRNNIPLLIDIRDLWPDIFLNQLRRWHMAWAGKMVLARDYSMLTYLLKNADALIAVSEGYLKWGLDRIHRSKTPFDRVYYLGYKCVSDNGAHDRFDVPVWLKGMEKKKLFVFLGTFGVSYELELILDAAYRFGKLGRTDIYFILAGAGEHYELIKERAAGLRNVILPGWIGEDEINVLLKMAYVGLVPCRSVINTIPNKPFEYLSAGLPLINSLEGEMAELIDRHGLGLNYLPGDLEGLCQCIKMLISDSSLYGEISENVSEFFELYGDANKIYSEYAAHIEEIVLQNKKKIA